MALNKRPTFVNRPNITPTAFVNSDADDVKALVNDTTGSGVKVVALFATGEVTANRVLKVLITRGVVEHPLVAVNIPLNAGRDPAVPPVDLFTSALREILPKDADGQPYIYLADGDTVSAQIADAVTDTESVNVFAVFGSFDDEG